MVSAQGRPARHVLLVEDDALHLRQTQRVLQQAGYEVHGAGDAAGALQLLTSPLAPNLVIVDVILPDLSGLDLARRVRQLCPQSPIILVSGYGVSWQPDGLPAGAVYLPKPFTSAELLAVASRLLASDRDMPPV